MTTNRTMSHPLSQLSNAHTTVTQAAEAGGMNRPWPAKFLATVGRIYLWPAQLQH